MAQKKSFKEEINSPALRFISSANTKPDEGKSPSGQSDVPDGYILNPKYIEPKRRRCQFLLQQSLYDKLQAKAEQERISVNSLVHSLLKDAFK